MQVKIVSKLYKTIRSFLVKNLPFRIKSNGEYTKKDVINALIRAEAEETTIESATRRSESISSDDVFYHLNKLSITEVIKCMEDGIEQAFLDARKKNRITGKADIAIDVHEIEYYGKLNNAWVIGGKPKNGTGNFFKVISLCIVVREIRYTVAVIPMNMFDITVHLVERLIKTAMKYITIQYVLLDRGFLSVDIINELYELQMEFVIPIKRNDKVVRTMGEAYLKDIDRVQYTMKSDKKEATFDLVIYETKDDLVGFATNIAGEAGHIAELYRKRWGIETSYRVKNGFYGRTCSNKVKIRLLLILLSFMLYNFWVLANKELECSGFSITAKDMCIAIVKAVESDNGIP